MSHIFDITAADDQTDADTGCKQLSVSIRAARPLAASLPHISLYTIQIHLANMKSKNCIAQTLR